MRNLTAAALALTLSVMTLSSAQLGESLKNKKLDPCTAQDTCKLLGRWTDMDSYYGPIPRQSYQIVNRNIKMILSSLPIFEGDDEVVSSVEYVATRYPLTQQDKAFLLTVINRAAKGRYSQDLLDRCFARIDAQTEDAEHGNEDVLLATESIGIRCFKRRYTHWYASGIRIFWPVG